MATAPTRSTASTDQLTERELRAWRGMLRAHAQLTKALDADPARSVLQYLGKHPHDLIVLATHQHDGFDRWTHKRVAEPIARRSGEMTLFIPHGSEGFISLESGAASLRNILIPVDHSPDPQIAVDGAVSLARTLECRGMIFTLLYVGEEDRFPDG